MKRLTWVLSCVAVVLFVFSSAQAKENTSSQPASESTKEKAGLPGYWGIMAGELKLSDDMKAKIQEQLLPLQDWDKANKPKIEELATKMKYATDKEAREKLAEQVKALTQEREKLMGKIKVDVLALLTPDQQLQWKVSELYNDVSRRFARLELTEAQSKQARELASPFAKQILELKSPVDAKALKEIRTAYANEIVAKVLTDEQRTKFDSAAQSKPSTTEKKK